MDVRSIALSAGVPTRITVPGRFFILVETGEALDVQFERRNGRLGQVGRDVEAGFKVFPGDWSDPRDFNFDAVVLTSTNAQTIRYGISAFAADYAATLGVVQIQQPNSGATAIDATAGVASSVIAAANASRRKIHIQNVGANNARVAPGTVTATRGVQLAPGQSVTFETTAAINAIREGGSDTTLSITEETRA